MLDYRLKNRHPFYDGIEWLVLGNHCLLLVNRSNVILVYNANVHVHHLNPVQFKMDYIRLIIFAGLQCKH